MSITREDSQAIARALDNVRERFGDRWAIRGSGQDGFGALSEHDPRRAFPCLEQTGRRDTCASCGKCKTAKAPVRFFGHARPLPVDHDAIANGQSRFQGKLTNLDPLQESKVLKPSTNGKLGKRAEAKAWNNPEDRPILTLTLQERVTCPVTCEHWLDCYGNNMHLARRLAHGTHLQDAIRRDLGALDGKPVLVRLHVLGDFYSVEYVEFWSQMLVEFPNVDVFGYTAHPIDTTI